MKKVTITIVTPSYNQGQFIEETIKSVLAQEGDFFIDYIIADGGSTDNSVEIIKKYDELLKNKEYPIKCRGIEYRWWSRKDKGQSHAINQGFKIAKGDILGWINSDDTYLFTNTINNVVKAFRENKNADVIFGDLAFLGQNGEIMRFYAYQKFDYRKLLSYRYNLGQPAVFFRAEVLEKNGLREDLNYVMDYELWMRLARDYKFKHLPEPIAGFRVYKGSKSGRESKRNFLVERQRVLLEYGSEEESRLYFKILDKFFRGGNARMKGLVYLIKYRYFQRYKLAFKGKYLNFPSDIITQLFGSLR